MFLLSLLVLGLGVLPVRADWWDGFSNNLATDLAPFLSLFGEQLTKQYLSESISILDNIIFALAPVGIITAVASVIRVCGSPSMRALIGRAQEGGGNAEAELCSSTSWDVCELFNNGGIARVFGRPKIIEVVHDPNDDAENDGVDTFADYITTTRGNLEWKHEAKHGHDSESKFTQLFAPNLSLNIGIKRRHPAVAPIVALLGFFLQAGVVAFAAIVTYHLRWEMGDRALEPYAFPMFVTGTLLLALSMFFCAYLIGQSTDEHLFRRSKLDKKSPSTIYWLQPGDQIIGDQLFHPVSYSDQRSPLQQYMTSWKSARPRSLREVWAVVGSSVLGFILQFVGLRGILGSRDDAFLCVVPQIAAAESRANRTPLHYAAGCGAEGAVKAFLENPNATVNLTNAKGQTALWVAAANGYAEVVKLLLDDGRLRADERDNELHTPLATAAFNNATAAVKTLLGRLPSFSLRQTPEQKVIIDATHALGVANRPQPPDLPASEDKFFQNLRMFLETRPNPLRRTCKIAILWAGLAHEPSSLDQSNEWTFEKFGGSEFEEDFDDEADSEREQSINLLNKVCRAHIFVAQISPRSLTWGDAGSPVAEALTWAVKDHDVDIIVVPIQFKSAVSAVKNAIRTYSEDRAIIITGEGGFMGDKMSPLARDGAVITVMSGKCNGSVRGGFHHRFRTRTTTS